MTLIIILALITAFVFAPVWLTPVLTQIENQHGINKAQATLATIVHGAGVLALVALALI